MTDKCKRSVLTNGHEIHIFIPKFGQNSHFFPKSTHGGDPPVYEIFLKKDFFTASLNGSLSQFFLLTNPWVELWILTLTRLCYHPIISVSSDLQFWLFSYHQLVAKHLIPLTPPATPPLQRLFVCSNIAISWTSINKTNTNTGVTFLSSILPWNVIG